MKGSKEKSFTDVQRGPKREGGKKWKAQKNFSALGLQHFQFVSYAPAVCDLFEIRQRMEGYDSILATIWLSS